MCSVRNVRTKETYKATREDKTEVQLLVCVLSWIVLDCLVLSVSCVVCCLVSCVSSCVVHRRITDDGQASRPSLLAIQPSVVHRRLNGYHRRSNCLSIVCDPTMDNQFTKKKGTDQTLTLTLSLTLHLNRLTLSQTLGADQGIDEGND